MSELNQLLELEKRRCAAISGGDIETLRSLLSDDYVHVHMNAAVDDRAQHLEGIAKRPRTTTRGEIHVRMYGDLAVLTGELVNQMAAPGHEPRVVRAYCHQVAVRLGGAWRFVSIQLIHAMTDAALDREVLEAEDARCKATREGDLEALKRILHEDYTHVTGSASVMNREQYLAWVSATPRRHERHDLCLRRHGDTAVIVGGLTNHLSEAGGGTRVIEAMVTQVAIRQGGAWRFIAFQITPKR